MGHPNAIETRRIMALEDPLKRLIGVMRGMDKAEVEDYFDKCKDGVDASGNNILVFPDSSIIQVIQGVEYDDDGTPETVIKLKVMENESEQRGSPK